MSGKSLLNQIKSFKPDGTGIEKQGNKMQTEKKQLIRKIQTTTGKWDKAFRLPCVYLLAA